MQVNQGKRKLPVFFVTLFLLVGTMFLFYNLSNSNLYICPQIGMIGRAKSTGTFHRDNQWGWGGSGSNDEELSVARKYDFDISGNDVMVFLHIQKTGGTTFGKHLVHDLDLETPCQCAKGRRRCPCLRKNSKTEVWQFSRFSVGWACGLHADWTELQSCVPWYLNKKEGKITRRRYYYITMLRNPVERFISEWRHVYRGATWKASKHVCNGREPTPEELPSCYADHEDWTGVLLNEFLECPHNLASNRQVRMLADLSLVGCYNLSKYSKEERNAIMLESAKTNLRRLSYFGLTEFQKESQYIFEETFNLKFKTAFEQNNDTHASAEYISDEDRQRVVDENRLDVELYEYAKDLFFQRLTYMEEHEGDRPPS
ncbi:Heparan-sulfate 6-O-sulfotransferase 2 [Holothuria leucospilota]|uniref:Heparan-sulfate 6-O-sulfotransferase n=1 Tax=Holothuria leucospilota TaxID=206669 RepID=A0A9Q1BQ78_HOLLE|nr:Heparan-sulfate 6-O-sulfotransferase 2 [Holothuria leucospilota]